MSRSRSLPYVALAVTTGVAALGSGCLRGPRHTAAAPAAERVEALILAPSDTGYDGLLRVASIFPTVGRYAVSGIESARGARLAVADLNRRGGIRGRGVKLLEYQTGSYFVDARQAAEQAVRDGGVLAIIGANSSSLSMPIADVAEARGVVQVSNISTAEDLTWDPASRRERRYVFRVCGSDTVMGALLADFAQGPLRARRVAVLYEVGGAYSARLAQSFIKSFHAPSAGRVAEEFFYVPREIDFREQLRAIKAFGADVVFLPGFFSDATLVARQAADLGLSATLLGGDGWSNRVLFKRSRPPGAAYYADLCSPPAAFRERYRSVYGEEAEGCRAVLAYDAVLAVAEAIAAVGALSDADLTSGLRQTRERLRRALTGIEFVGRTGRIRFDAHRNREGGTAIMEVSCGRQECQPHLIPVKHGS